jgi:DNA-binding response OmpR family regulator
MPHNVLIAEDDDDFAKFLGDLLQTAGYSYAVFKDGLAAHRAFKDGGFDLAILDLALPNFSGVEVLRFAKHKNRKIPILVLTGHDTPETRALVKDAGGASFLDKKATPETILKELALLAKRSPNE